MRTLFSPSQSVNLSCVPLSEKESLQFKRPKSNNMNSKLQFSNRPQTMQKQKKTEVASINFMMSVDRTSQLSSKENISPFTIRSNLVNNSPSIPSTNKFLQFNKRIHRANPLSNIQLNKQSSFSREMQQSITPFALSFNNIQTTLQKQQLKLSDFTKIKHLGKGKFGSVQLVVHNTTGFVCALKVIQKRVILEQKVIHQIARQIRIHNSLKHENIIQFYGYFSDQSNVYMVSEYGTGGELYKELKKTYRLPEQQVAPIIKCVVNGLQHIHSMGFIHRDLKPQNVLLQFGVAKICDLGWAAPCDQMQTRKSYCGTPLYLSPEMVRKESYDGQTDVWAVGVLTYEMIVGRIPFKVWTEYDLPVILDQEVTFPSYIDVSQQCSAFIMQCLAKSQFSRITISSLAKHPFLFYLQSLHQPIDPPLQSNIY